MHNRSSRDDLPKRRPAPRPWCDRSGRFSPLKTIVLALLPLPALIAGVQWASGGFNGHATDFLLAASGFWSDRLLVVVLAITPAAAIFALPRATLVRRMIGIAAALYVLAHLAVYAVQQHFAWGFIVLEASTVPVLVLGSGAVLGLALLVATSTDAMVRLLGRNWKRLHLLVHPIVVAALAHSFMEAKLDVSLSATFAGCYLWLVLWRLMPRRRKRHLPSLAVLAVVAAVGTAVIEWGWYAVATGLPANRVFAANFSLEAGIRPAQWVALLAFAIVVMAGGVRLFRRGAIAPKLARAGAER